MRLQKPFLAVLAVGAFALALLVGCGSSNDNSSSSSSGATASTAAPATAGAGAGATTTDGVVNTGDSDLGTILVDSNGRTLYLFEADTGGKSTCNGQCAQVWPPFIAKGKVTAGAGADASKLGTTKRTDGSLQVTYNGLPLYYYVTDSKPGDTTGNNVDQFGAEWYAVTPAGVKVSDSGSSAGTTSGTSSDSSGSSGSSGSGGGGNSAY
jgi:predicted lipoprotein with Yx(FWY)xxD motif